MSSADILPSGSRSHGMMYSTTPADFEILLLLTQAQSLNGFGSSSPLQSRRPAMDPLILETATASDPHITRHHYLHEFYPQEDHFSHHSDTSSVSDLSIHDDIEINISRSDSPLNQQQEQFEIGLSSNSPLVHSSEFQANNRSVTKPETEFYSSGSSSSLNSVLPPPLQVNCEARARIPTPHGEMFLHLYHNNRDGKEHLAIVVDHDQMNRIGDESQYIRSRSLDKVLEGETEMDRLVRGAYVGRLTTGVQVSSPATSSSSSLSPLVRVHSECFTGETVGSQRCDCGEQLDSALSLISQEGKGVIVYLRQEGRGIGLLNKLKAYNLQDLGRDTVAANLELGFGEDERTYDIAAEILRDLGLGCGVKLLTNNPSKVQSLEVENIKVVERREMRPRAWTCQDEGIPSTVEHIHRLDSGIGMIGGSATKSVELEKYLKTKVERMGHMLQLPESSKSLK